MAVHKSHREESCFLVIWFYINSNTKRGENAGSVPIYKLNKEMKNLFNTTGIDRSSCYDE